MEVDWSAIGCGSPLHASDDLLSFVAIVNVWRNYFFICVIVAGDEEGVETEGGGFVGEVGESWVLVVVNVGLPIIVNRLLYFFDSGSCCQETFYHGYKAVGGHRTDRVG